MPKTEAEIASMTLKRRRTISKSTFSKLMDAWSDPDTGAGYVLAEKAGWGRKGAPETYAYFFRPRAVNRSFHEEKITSNHQLIAVRDRLKELLNAEKAAKAAPHDLKAGDVLANIWGATMRDVSFWQVVSIPAPKKVSVVRLPSQITEGDWMSGKKMPVLPEDGLAEGETHTHAVSMADGTARLKTESSIETFRRWDGNPVSIYSD